MGYEFKKNGAKRILDFVPQKFQISAPLFIEIGTLKRSFLVRVLFKMFVVHILRNCKNAELTYSMHNANIYGRSQSVQLYAASAAISGTKFILETHIASPINVVTQIFHYLSK